MAGFLLTVSAAPIDQAQAVQTAWRWLNLSPEPMGRKAGVPVTARTYFNAAQEARFHVVELQPAGFVVIAADDEMEAVIAFSHTNQFDPRPGNPLFDLLNKDIEGRAQYLHSDAYRKGKHLKSKEQGKWERLRMPLPMAEAPTSGTGAASSTSTVSDVCVAPLVQSLWNQTVVYSGTTELAVYNYYTPPYAAGNVNNYYSGCTATAWAQIMRFHQWPQASVGTGTFSVTVGGIAQQMSLRGGNGAGGPYDWANMVLAPGAGLTNTQAQAIGALLVDAGVANNMDYESDGSAAYLHSSAIMNVFHYANAVYADSVFNTLSSMLLAIRTNLDAGLPVALSIWNATDGHEVVCDGYGYNMSTLYHHINMGWGGSDNLWYNLPTIYTYTSVDGCSYNIDPLVHGEIISGRITNLSGTPLAGVTVTLSGTTTLTTTTGSTGIFAFKGLGSNSSWTLTPQAAGYVFGPCSAAVNTGSSKEGTSIGNRIADFQAGSSSQTGFLQITISPLHAANLGAQWQVDNTGWHNSGEFVTGLLSGSHIVLFKSASGWITPSSLAVTVNTSQLTTAVGIYAPFPKVSTFAGKCGYSGSLNATGTNARFSNPYGIAVDGSGNLYVADSGNHTIRKIASTGLVSTLAGASGLSGTTDATGTNAKFNSPHGVAVDGSGNIYVADSGNHTIRMITPTGAVSTLAGTPSLSGTTDATGTNARFYNPTGVAVDGSGNVYVADDYNETIRLISPSGVVSTFAGAAGYVGATDAMGTSARFNSPYDVAVDGNGNVYVADSGNNTIRKITSTGVVSTLAGTSGGFGSSDGVGANARFNYPSGIAVDASGNVYVADTWNHTIREITSTGAVSTLAGNPGTSGALDGTGDIASFCYPYKIAVDGSGNLYVGDTYNYAVREIAPATVTIPVVATGAANGVTGTSATLTGTVNPNGASTTALFEYGLTNAYGNSIPVILSPANGTNSQTVTTMISGLQTGKIYHYRLDASNLNGVATGSDAIFSTEGVPVVITGTVSVVTATSATLTGTVNPNGYATTAWFEYGLTTLYGGTATVTLSPSNGTVAQAVSAPLSGLQPGATYHYRLNGLNSVGQTLGYDITFTLPLWVSTFAGNPAHSGAANGTGTAAKFNYPCGVAVDASGNVYVSDQGNYLIRKITKSGTVSVLAGGVEGTDDGTGAAAQFWWPKGIALDSANNLYVADYSCIRKITTAGVVTTFAGDPYTTGTDNGYAAFALFNAPNGIGIDKSNNLYIADSGNHTIRKITTAGNVTTFAGSPGVSGTANGTGINARFNNPTGVAVDSNGNVYVADCYNHTIRKITSTGSVSTFAGFPGTSGYVDGTGTAAQFYRPYGVSVDSVGNVYVADQDNQLIRKISATGVVTTLAGVLYQSGTTDGLATTALFDYPSAVAVDGTGNIYVADSYNETIRKISQAFSKSPVVTLNGSNPLQVEAASSYADPGASAMDAKGLPLTPVMASNTVVPTALGSYIVKWTATDSLGYSGTAVRTVNVVDTTPPLITTPTSITINASTATGAYVYFTTTATDFLGGVVATTNNPASGSFFPMGTSTVMTMASDAVGNVAFKPFNVTVTVPAVSVNEASASKFAFAISGTAVNLTVKSSIAGRNYQLQYCDDMAKGNWFDVGLPSVGNGATLPIIVSVDLSVKRRFYRVKLY